MNIAKFSKERVGVKFEVTCKLCGEKEMRHRGAKYCSKCSSDRNRQSAAIREEKFGKKKFGWMWYLLLPDDVVLNKERKYGRLDYGNSGVSYGHKTPKRTSHR